ncbi:MAG: hypothetical protein ACLQK4_14970 [Acidimicrobiales bacterium]|jgi:membrane protein YdbS with pleckstrin-like domain
MSRPLSPEAARARTLQARSLAIGMGSATILVSAVLFYQFGYVVHSHSVGRGAVAGAIALVTFTIIDIVYYRVMVRTIRIRAGNSGGPRGSG